MDSSPTFDRSFWDERWSEVLEENGAFVAQRPPNPFLTAEAEGLVPGRALDAGCGHGSESLWLAAHGWEVTAVDFSPTVLDHARSVAAAVGPDVAGRIDWVERDLGVWTPEPGAYDLVVSLYVHVAGSLEQAVSRLASGVARDGTLLMVGHLPIDPVTGAPTPAQGQNQVTVAAARAALGADLWEITTAEERPRAATGTGFDAVIRARRRA
jgi:SAM-dependent methyltransferase